MKKNNIKLLGIAVVIIAIILLINYVKSNGDHTEETYKCIAQNSILIVSKICGHCANQKALLGDYLDLFNLIDIQEHPEVWEQYDLIGVPTWVINNQTYPGVQSIDKLKQITGC